MSKSLSGLTAVSDDLHAAMVAKAASGLNPSQGSRPFPTGGNINLMGTNIKCLNPSQGSRPFPTGDGRLVGV